MDASALEILNGSMKVAIVILNWNGRECLSRFLPSVIAYSTRHDISVYVADNGSSDDSVAFVKENFGSVQVIELSDNFGFAGGYNRALQSVESDLFVLLNSDVEVTSGWLDPLIAPFGENERLGACMPKILSERDSSLFEYAGAAGGFIDRLGYPFCRGRLFDAIEKDCGQYDSPIEVFWASGACMVVRASLYRSLGGLDEHFFAHMEEIDFCWRLKNAGFAIQCIPSSVVFHQGGATLETGSPFKVYLNFRNNLLMLYKNLPASRFGLILFVRQCLDGLAALRFLSGGRWNAMRAVWKAHLDFRRALPKYRALRASLPIPGSFPGGVYKKSVVVAYFLGGVRCFSQLKSRDFS